MRPIHFGTPATTARFGALSIYDSDTGGWSDETPGSHGDRWTPGSPEVGKTEEHVPSDTFDRQQPGLQIVPVSETPETGVPTDEEMVIISSILDKDRPKNSPPKRDPSTLH